MERKGWIKNVEVITAGRKATEEEIKSLKIVDYSINSIDEFVKEEKAQLFAVYVNEDKKLYNFYYLLLGKDDKVVMLKVVSPKKPVAIINENIDDKRYLMRVVDLWKCQEIDSKEYHRKKYEETLEEILARNRISKDDIVIDYCDGYRQRECEFLCWD